MFNLFRIINKYKSFFNTKLKGSTEKTNLNTFKIFFSFWGHLSKKRKFQVIILIIFMLLSALAELISFGSFIPFLVVITSKDEIIDNPFINILSSLTNQKEISSILVICVLIFIFAGIISALIRTFNLWLNTRLAASIGSDLSKKAYRNILFQPYEEQISKNSSNKMAALIVHMNSSISGLFLLFQLITSIIVSILMLIGFFVIEWPYGLITPLFFGIAYLFISIILKDKLRKNSFKIAELENKKIKTIRESLDSIRDIILDGSHEIFINNYLNQDTKQRVVRANNWFFNSAPRFSFEALAILILGTIALVILSSNDFTTLITTLGILAVGSQRLLPSLQQIYSFWSNLKGSIADINIILSILNLEPKIPNKHLIALDFRERISFQKVNFRYKKNSSYIFKDLSFEINKGDIVGIVGESGEGKSTLVDLIMGLIKPSSGEIYVDNNLINGKDDLIPSWQKSIAHVPQSICLIDSNFSENIAFGVSTENIDMVRVKECAKKANISNFIEKFPEKYNNRIGERGASLSGGQKQRIGIARAFYKDSNLIIFDEATSALDIKTENKVMDSIYSLSKKSTIILIAHRSNTLKKCNKIFKLENNKIINIKIN